MSVWSCSTGRLLNIKLLFSEMLCKNNIRLITMHLISQHEYECNSALIYCVSKCVWRVKEQIDRGIWMLLTVSVHHPHLAPTCMQSPQDKALALMHSLPSAEQKRRRELHIYSFDSFPSLRLAVIGARDDDSMFSIMDNAPTALGGASSE